GFSSLTQATGGADLSGSVPKELQAPEGLQLTELGLIVDFSAPAILAVRVTVGMKTHWALVAEKLVVDEIALTFLVSNPFAKSRSVSLTLAGEIAIGEVKLGVFAEFPSFRFGGGLPLGETIPLGTLLHAHLPGAPELPAMSIDRLIFDADPTEQTFAMACA